MPKVAVKGVVGQNVKTTVTQKKNQKKGPLYGAQNLIDLMNIWEGSSKITNSSGHISTQTNTVILNMYEILTSLIELQFVDKNGVLRNFAGPISVKSADQNIKESDIEPNKSAKTVLGGLSVEQKIALGVCSLSWRLKGSERRNQMSALGFYLLNSASMEGASLKTYNFEKTKTLEMIRSLYRVMESGNGAGLKYDACADWVRSPNSLIKLDNIFAALTSYTSSKGVSDLIINKMGFEFKIDIRASLFDGVVQVKEGIERRDSNKVKVGLNKICNLLNLSGNAEHIKPHGVYALQTVLEALSLAPKEAFNAVILAKKSGWFQSYKGIHPLWVLAESGRYSGSDAEVKRTELLDLFIQEGFTPNGLGPDGKSMRKPSTAREGILLRWVRNLFSEKEEFRKQIYALVQHGADPNEVNTSGRSVLSLLNSQAGHSYASQGVKKMAEELFVFLSQNGADPMSIVPKKEAEKLAKTPAIKELIKSHTERMALIASLDNGLFEEALEIAKKLKSEREAAKPVPEVKTRRL